MPKIALTNEQKVDKKLKDLTRETKIALYDAGIKKKAVAEIAGVTPSAVTQQFNSGKLTLSVYLAAQVLLEEQ